MAILTTACGSVALLFADFPGLAQLGMLTMVGILAAGAMRYWVLPLWIPAATVRVPEPVKTPMQAPHAKWRWRVVAALVFVVAGFSWNRPWFDDDVASLNPLPATLKDQDRELRDALGAPDLRYLLVVNGPTREDVLHRTEEMRPGLQGLVAGGAIRGFDLVSDLLPSESTQATRQAALPPGPRLRANLDEAQTGLPFRPHTFDPFLADVEAARNAPPLSLTSMAAPRWHSGPNHCCDATLAPMARRPRAGTRSFRCAASPTPRPSLTAPLPWVTRRFAGSTCARNHRQ
jgi:predicted exporter